jgi:hypothetical protein
LQEFLITMKNLIFGLIFFFVGWGALVGQTDLVFHARPTQMGYCVSTGDVCLDELAPLTGNDLSGYLLKIFYQKASHVRLELFRNGQLIEQIFSAGFTEIKLSRNFFKISAEFLQSGPVFHFPGRLGQHTLYIDISKKIKKGKISFHYPEEQRVYLYVFDLL